MATWKFNDSPCIIQNALKQECERIGIDHSWWWLKASQFRWTTGATPGRGYVLMLREDVENLSITGKLEIKDDLGTTHIMPTLLVVRSICVTPGYPPDDRKSAYLVELSDLRYAAKMSAVCIQNNVITPYGTVLSVDGRGENGNEPTYMEHGRLFDGGERTWNEFIGTMWLGIAPSGGASLLGAYPGLPVEPPGHPYDFRFPHYLPGLDSLEAVLNAIGCTITFDPFANIYGIAEVGKQQDYEDLKNYLDSLDGSNPPIIRDEPKENAAANIPSFVRVCFYNRKWSTCRTTSALTLQDQWPLVPAYTFDVQGVDIHTELASLPGTHVVIWDSFPIVFNPDDSLANLADVQEIAEWRAEKWYQAAIIGGEKLHRVYEGFVDLSIAGSVSNDPNTPAASGMLPLRGIAYYDIGDGLKTEIIKKPYGLRGIETWDHDEDWTLNDCYYPHENLLPPDIVRRRTPDTRIELAQLLTNIPPNQCGEGFILTPHDSGSQSCSIFWTSCGEVQPLFNPGGKELRVTGKIELDKVAVKYDWYLNRWVIIGSVGGATDGQSLGWVKVTDRCGRAYSGQQVRPIVDIANWPIPEWSQCTDPSMFEIDNGGLLFLKNLFDVNGGAPNVQGGVQPLITQFWFGGFGTPPLTSLCIPPKPEDNIWYMMDLGMTNECDSERYPFAPS